MIVNPKDKKYFKSKNTIRYNGQLLSTERALVMGILNVTPDSFFDGGRFFDVDKAVGHAVSMIEQGADIIDVGACSTRPGADLLSAKIELDRLLPVLSALRKMFPDIVLSIDTFRAEVAETVVQQIGDVVINDISGGQLDEMMFETVARLKVPYVLMHMQGTPQNMQNKPSYSNVTKEVIKTLSEGVYRLHELGVSDVIIDPGFGFGKTLEHNYELFNHLDAFRFFELPLLVGVSRKSMIYKLLGHDSQHSLNGTTVLNTLALQAGASILRVHDVVAAVEAVSIYEKLKEFAQ
ncbi:MAG TPA: dihydropteroate synthase [Prolixibacteraceae bacterium]|nr:dihydropteroate synthase [Prolixibacteraceae bacterium]HPR60234.1 dihydropteroate synthase [Prolixibacteraceae bacterium]